MAFANHLGYAEVGELYLVLGLRRVAIFVGFEHLLDVDLKDFIFICCFSLSIGVFDGI